MKNQKGITMITLIATIIIMLIIASITLVTSLSAFKQMRYETFKAELEEIAQAVDETCEDYALSKKTNSSITSYTEYFTYKYGSSPSLARKCYI